MKRVILFVLSALMILGLAACGGTGEEDPNKVLNVPENYTLVSTEEATGVTVHGISVEFDPHFFSQNVTRGNVREEDWQIVVDRVKKMEIHRFRVMLLPSWLEPLNDNDDPAQLNWEALTTESAELQSVYKVLELAQSEGIDVNITLWGAEKKVNLVDLEMNERVNSQGVHFLSQGNQGENWIIGTLKPEEFAENFSAYVQQLVINKGFTCIKEITPINEPCWSYQVNGSSLGDFEAYAALCRAIDARFREDGIRDLVKFNLSDNTDGRVQWLQDTVSELDGIADLYNSHTYIFGYNTDNETIENWEIENLNRTRSTGKVHVIGEFGSNQTTGSTRQSDIDTYERGVLIVRQMLNFFNAGAAGASYWVLFDEYYNYNAAYNEMMQLGLWTSARADYADDQEYYRKLTEDYQIRPQYYAFSLMTKHVKRGAEIYPILLNDNFAVGTAFRNPDGKWVYAFANGNPEGSALKIALQNGSVYGSFARYDYAEDRLPEGDALIESSSQLTVSGQVLAFELAPNTVTLLCEI